MMVVKKWHGGDDDDVNDIDDDVNDDDDFDDDDDDDDDVNDDVNDVDDGDKGDGLYYFQTTNQWFDIFKNSRGNCFDSKFKFHCNPSLLLVCHNFAHFFV